MFNSLFSFFYCHSDQIYQKEYQTVFEAIEEIIDGGSLGEFESILLGPRFSSLFVVLPLSSGFVIKRIVGVRFSKKTLDGKEN